MTQVMTPVVFAKLYALTIPVFFAIDMLWLGIVAKGFYRRHLDSVFSQNVNWVAAIAFYLIYIAGILLFAVRPAMRTHSWEQAMMWGALFGFFTYATYDLTNLATIDKWPLAIVVVDILWGAVLCGVVAPLSLLLAKRLL
jgi:uncharacterized membrane protein